MIVKTSKKFIYIVTHIFFIVCGNIMIILIILIEINRHIINMNRQILNRQRPIVFNCCNSSTSILNYIHIFIKFISYNNIKDYFKRSLIVNNYM